MTNLRTQMQAAIEEAYAGVNVTNFYLALEKVFLAGAKLGARYIADKDPQYQYEDQKEAVLDSLQKELTEQTK